MATNVERAPRTMVTEQNKPAVPRGDWFTVETERNAARFFRVLIIAAIVVFGLLRLWNFTYDIPPHAPLLGFPGKYSIYSWDGDVYGDEGFYANDAINWMQDGVFYLPLEYNQFINLPVMQFIKAGFFMVFGMNLFAVRLVSLLCAVGMAVSVYFLVRRYEDHWTSLLAVFFVAINHYIFVYSRYAVDEVPVAFWVTLTFALAVRVRGDHWWRYAILTSVAFACALLTKYNAVFAAPLVAVAVIIQELDWKKILLKFILCSVVFFAIMGTWYVALVMPHRDDFAYFFTLNVGIGATLDLGEIKDNFKELIKNLRMVDYYIAYAMAVMTPILLILSRRYRIHPLVYLALAWVALYMLMYAYYGRFYPRFLMMVVPPMAIWLAVSLRHALDMRGPFRLVTYLFIGVIGLSALWQMHRDVSVLAIRKNTHNEMAADILRIVEADPSGNRVIMGHVSGALALRNGLIPRHDRYSPHPLRERFAAFKPGWVLADGEFRITPNDSYSDQVEWYELYFDTELVASYDMLENFRGHNMHLYKLTPREEVVYPPPIVRAQFMGIESVSDQRRRAASGEEQP